MRFGRFAWGVLVFTVAVILWGAYVRATGSGAGCGEHWPLCNGEVIPRAPAAETLIELAHRITSGLSLVLVLALAIWAFRLFPPGHRARAATGAAAVFVCIEALIGAGLVLLGLVADDRSVTRAIVLGVHLTNTFLLLAALALSGQYAATSAPAPRWRHGGLTAAAAAALAGCLVIGVSGAVAALGDTLFPAASLGEALRQDLSATAHVFLRLRVHHPWIAVLVGLGLGGFALHARNRFATRLGRLPTVLVAVIGAQILVGLVNVALLAPVWLQLVHLGLADALWIVLILLVAAALDAEAQAAPYPTVDLRSAAEGRGGAG
jgi:heme A synthase